MRSSRLTTGAHALARSAAAACFLLTVGACAGTTPAALPTVGATAGGTSSTSPPPPTEGGSSAALAAEYGLTGMALPADWPTGVPLPSGTRVVSAFAIGEDPDRTWSASFVGPADTGADKLAKPIVKALKKDGFEPTSEYHDPDDVDSGLYGLAGRDLAVYLVLGETDGHPSIVMSVRQRG